MTTGARPMPVLPRRPRVQLQLCRLPLLSLLLAGPAAAGPDGAALFAAKGCNTCHGAKGESPSLPLYPMIRGQNAEYAFQQMRDIRDGRRTNAMSAAMQATVTQVSDAESRPWPSGWRGYEASQVTDLEGKGPRQPATIRVTTTPSSYSFRFGRARRNPVIGGLGSRLPPVGAAFAATGEVGGAVGSGAGAPQGAPRREVLRGEAKGAPTPCPLTLDSDARMPPYVRSPAR